MNNPPKYNPATPQEKERIEAGLQCPECHGANVIARFDRFLASAAGFQCNDCGCNWSRRVGKKS